MTQIVGVTLIRNEDLYIEWVLGNILEFCDRIIVLDNNSTDKTWDIVKELARSNNKMELMKWDYYKDSQQVLKPLYSTDTWVFGVDGDEVYDPNGLLRFRSRLLAGEFDDAYGLRGHFLNCTNVDTERHTASGYLAPPAREATKLYNFRIVNGWSDDSKTERLHGHPRFSEEPKHKKLFLPKAVSWEEAELRCLHLCFIPRSSSELNAKVSRFHRVCDRFGRLFRPSNLNDLVCRAGAGSSVKYKMRQYAKGELAQMDISDFFTDALADRESNVQP